MRITSVMPQTYAGKLREHTNTIQENKTVTLTTDRHVNSLNYATPVYLKGLSKTEKSRYIHLTFTGGDKNINQFLSYAPENKRYGINSYNMGGLGVVAQEGPESWRLREGADVRDFSPYHAYANPDGGVKVVEIIYDENGTPKKQLPKDKFHHAEQMEHCPYSFRAPCDKCQCHSRISGALVRFQVNSRALRSRCAANSWFACSYWPRYDLSSFVKLFVLLSK